MQTNFSRINLTDSKDAIINKIKKAKTDSLPIPDEEQKLKDRPEAKNLLGIYSSVSNQTLGKTLNLYFPILSPANSGFKKTVDPQLIQNSVTK